MILKYSLHRRALTLMLVVAFCLQGCGLRVPEGIEPVTNFELKSYLGQWYEIARLDHRFERGLEQIKTIYSQQENGKIRVENMGVDEKTGKQRTAVGKAKFVGKSNVGHLKVSFLGPFYGSYVVFYLEEDYSVALVCGNTKDYCWILARAPKLDDEKLHKYLEIVEKNGFDVEKFIYPLHVQQDVVEKTCTHKD